MVQFDSYGHALVTMLHLLSPRIIERKGRHSEAQISIWELRRGFHDGTPIWFVRLRRRNYTLQGLQRFWQLGGVAIACNLSSGQEDVDNGFLGFGTLATC